MRWGEGRGRCWRTACGCWRSGWRDVAGTAAPALCFLSFLLHSVPRSFLAGKPNRLPHPLFLNTCVAAAKSARARVASVLILCVCGHSSCERPCDSRGCVSRVNSIAFSSGSRSCCILQLQHVSSDMTICSCSMVNKDFVFRFSHYCTYARNHVLLRLAWVDGMTFVHQSSCNVALAICAKRLRDLEAAVDNGVADTAATT
jgi:hypothetical protein